MPLYINKNNQQLGPFEESAIGDFLRSGAFSLNDLACHQGMTNWQPLHILMPHLAQGQTVSTQNSVSPAKATQAPPIAAAATIGVLALGAVGLLVGGFVGFALRPAAPFIGQLPFDIVITRGANLRGLDSLLVGLAQTSFNYMMTGAVLGGVVGAVAGLFGGPLLSTLSSKR